MGVRLCAGCRDWGARCGAQSPCFLGKSTVFWRSLLIVDCCACNVFFVCFEGLFFLWDPTSFTPLDAALLSFVVKTQFTRFLSLFLLFIFRKYAHAQCAYAPVRVRGWGLGGAEILSSLHTTPEGEWASVSRPSDRKLSQNLELWLN